MKFLITLMLSAFSLSAVASEGFSFECSTKHLLGREIKLFATVAVDENSGWHVGFVSVRVPTQFSFESGVLKGVRQTFRIWGSTENTDSTYSFSPVNEGQVRIGKMWINFDGTDSAINVLSENREWSRQIDGLTCKKVRSLN